MARTLLIVLLVLLLIGLLPAWGFTGGYYPAGGLGLVLVVLIVLVLLEKI